MAELNNSNPSDGAEYESASLNPVEQAAIVLRCLSREE